MIVYSEAVFLRQQRYQSILLAVISLETLWACHRTDAGWPSEGAACVCFSLMLGLTVTWHARVKGVE